MSTTWAAVASVMVLLAVAPGARAEDKLDKVVASGLRCYEELNFGCSIAKLTAAQARIDAGEALPIKDQTLACEALAFSYTSIDKGELAEAAFQWCFRVDPAYSIEADVVGPRIYPFFQRARQAFLRARLDLDPIVLPWPALVEVPPRLDLALHTPQEILLSGSGELEPRSHIFGFAAGAGLLFGNDASDWDPGLAVELNYGYSALKHLRVPFAVSFEFHGTARDDIKSGYPNALYYLGIRTGVEGVLTALDFVELTGGLLVGAGFAGVGGLEDKIGGALTLRLGVGFRIGSDFSAGVDLEPTLFIATLSDDSIGTSTTFPIMVRFDARF